MVLCVLHCFVTNTDALSTPNDVIHMTTGADTIATAASPYGVYNVCSSMH